MALTTKSAAAAARRRSRYVVVVLVLAALMAVWHRLHQLSLDDGSYAALAGAAMNTDWAIPPSSVLERRHGAADPVLDCESAAARDYWHHSFFTGFVESNATLLHQLDGFPVDWRIKRFGCFEGYSHTQGAMLWSVAHAENFSRPDCAVPFNSYQRPILGIDAATGRAVDFATPKLGYSARAEGHSWFHDDRLIGVLPVMARRMLAAYDRHHRRRRHDESTLPPRRDLDPFFDGGDTMDASEPPRLLPGEAYSLRPSFGSTVVRVPERHVFVVPLANERFIGQAMLFTLNTLARLWAVGAFDLPEAAIVIPAQSRKVMATVVSGIAPLLPRGITWRWADEDVTHVFERAHLVAPMTFEHGDPCTRRFIAEWLLPRALAHVRTDPTFAYGGDEAARADATVSAAVWARSLPRRISILKSGGPLSLAGDRVFAVGPEVKALLTSEGFVAVSDSSSVLHRVVLVNNCDVVAVTYGSLLFMVTQLSSPAARSKAGRGPLKAVGLVHPGYRGETPLYATFGACRRNKEEGVDVLLVNRSVATPPGVWSKLLFFDDSNDLSSRLRPAHLDFHVPGTCAAAHRDDGSSSPASLVERAWCTP